MFEVLRIRTGTWPLGRAWHLLRANRLALSRSVAHVNILFEHLQTFPSFIDSTTSILAVAPISEPLTLIPPMDVLLILVTLNSFLCRIVWLRFHASIGCVDTLVDHGFQKVHTMHRS